MTRIAIVILALIGLSACAASQPGAPVLGDGKVEILARAKLDVAAALKEAEAVNDKIAMQCWAFLLPKLEAIPDGPELDETQGAAHALQKARNVRRLVSMTDTDEYKIACGPLVQDTTSRLLRIGRLVGGVL